ncbi:beta-ketoacyl-[acyl-carrier-protein] synthase family protein [Allonocardiopsis opalescens]|uniref:3-oxoacyl-[acyl-carrier-protein] synthase II n=1 Tax=Allonocardiopsis opalescens TaxID=1144618 RepID=A0A2T0QCJ7_9ACTN|nr:beta-ketoacyl-[acyl-carrier-protein] synthase family protein [Allonocardiopsis opalescens]PRY01628.1 3-oxoacyl-[acyl-carrier-protein] synthase II [Allonocardiopsis opalescens]
MTATAAERGSAPAATDARGRHRVVVTGLGVQTPAGCDLDTFAETAWSGRSVARTVTRFDPARLSSRIACELPGFDPIRYVGAKAARRMDRFAQYAVAAALDALGDAGEVPGSADRCAVVCGVGMGGHQTFYEQSVLSASPEGMGKVSPLLVPMIIPNSASALIAMELGWNGPALAVAAACASGTTAVGEAARLIRCGEADTVLAGGCDNGVTLLSMAAFCKLGALSRRNEEPSTASRPFDRTRDGYVMGEGAAFLVLERLDLALARGARVYGEVLGYAHNNDAHHITAPLPDGSRAAQCMRRAMADAGMTPADVGSVNAHGTSTPANDAMEARALHLVFGERTPPVTAPKSVFGHLMGGAGAAEAVVAALTVARGSVPPSANFSEGDPGTSLDVVVERPRQLGARPVLSNSFGLGGHNACLVLGPVAGAGAAGLSSC